MPNRSEEISFANLWQQIPDSDSRIWSKNVSHRASDKAPLSWREVIELLCGALWHLELAAQIAPFPAESFSEPQGSLWKDWLEKRRQVSTQYNEGQFSSYALDDSLTPRLRYLVQNMLLADSILRTAGTWWLLSTRGQLDEQYHVLQNPEQADSSLKRQVLIVLAFRDSFMHGEMPPDRNGARFNFRKNWISGTLKDTPYSPAVVAAAGRDVWRKLAEIVNEAA